jgi:radical SAM superfamily enzyme YgiQ (UPF0313 family)
MRVLLISANTEKINMPAIPLGLMCVAEATRSAGHQVELLDLMFQQDPEGALRKKLAEFEPEVIGISVRNIDDQSLASPNFLLEKVRPLVEWCRTSSAAPLILGGAGYSIFPDEVLEYLGADLGVQGEGEKIFPAILERIGRGEDPANLPGVHVAGRTGGPDPEFCADLDAFPLPRDDAWLAFDPDNEDIWIPVETRRGCPNFCSYCSTFRIQGRTVRTRSPLLIARYVEKLFHRGFRRFYFVDNSFNIPESQGLEICRALSALRLEIRWRAILYPHGVTEELVRSMKRAGCVEVALGFESGCPRILKAMNKHFDPDEVRKANGMLAGYGIRRNGFLLFGAPGETKESVEESIRFADSLDLDGLRTTVGIRIYPGTRLEKCARAEGLLTPGDTLLNPRFYLAKEVDPWIHEAVKPGFTLKK